MFSAFVLTVFSCYYSIVCTSTIIFIIMNGVTVAFPKVHESSLE